MSNTYGVASLLQAAYSYISGSKISENQLVTNLDEACQALEAHATEVCPLLTDSDEGTRFSRIENAINLLESEGFVVDTDLRTRYREALSAYEDNFSGFIDAKSLGSMPLDAKKLTARNAHNQNQLRKKRLSQGPDTEVGAYANLLDQREKLRLAFQLRSDEKVLSSDIERLSESEGLSPRLQAACGRYRDAEIEYQERFQPWFDSQDNVTTRLLMNQAREKVETSGEESFVWRGRLEVLEKRVQLFDEVVKEGFTALYGAYKSEVGKEYTALHGRLAEIDLSLVGESRWGDSSWKIVKLCTWIGNAFSGWKNRDEAADLKRRYEALHSEAQAPKPTTEEEVRQWMAARPAIETLLPNRVSQSLQESQEHYLEEVDPHLKHETLESVVSGSDGFISKEQELRMLYQSLKAKNPTLKDKEGEQIDYDDRGQTLYVKGEGYNVTIGGQVDRDVRSSINATLMANDSAEGEISSLLKDKVIPPNIVGIVRRKDSSKREILYARPQVATFHNIGEKGDKDLLHSKIVASDRIVYEATDQNEIVFAEGALRFGCFVSDYDKALEKAPALVRTIALPILHRSYPGGTKVTLNLTYMSVGSEDEERKAEMDYSLNDDNKVDLELGVEFNQTLTKLAKSNPIGHYKSLEELRANFNEIKWESA